MTYEIATAKITEAATRLLPTKYADVAKVREHLIVISMSGGTCARNPEAFKEWTDHHKGIRAVINYTLNAACRVECLQRDNETEDELLPARKEFVAYLITQLDKAMESVFKAKKSQTKE
jgi:hypothetical protein